MHRINLSFSIAVFCLLIWLVTDSILVTTSISAKPLQEDPNLKWHTYLGSTENDRAVAVIPTSDGPTYVIGTSEAAWGEPVNPYSGGRDVFVARYGRSGNLIWLTFLGGQGIDNITAVTLSQDGLVYVLGTSNVSWGEPLAPFTGQQDIFIAEVGSSGKLRWNTFYGSTGDDVAGDIIFDNETNRITAVGTSDTTWDKPVNPFSGENSAFALQLNKVGDYQWHTFLGGSGIDTGNGIALANTGEIYIGGTSTESWGETTLSAHTNSRDGFVAQLNTDGTLAWNYFLGSAEGSDNVESITTDSQGNLYAVGSSWDSWGEPVNPFTGIGYFDAFVAKFNADGLLTWNTFLGSPSQAADADAAYDVAIGQFDRVYVIGDSRETWGEPLNPFAGERDAFVAEVNQTEGTLVWHTFLGGPDFDYGNGLTIDVDGNIIPVGYSKTNWADENQASQPVTPFARKDDGFIAKLLGCLPKCAVDTATESPATTVSTEQTAEENLTTTEATTNTSSTESTAITTPISDEIVAEEPLPEITGNINLEDVPQVIPIENNNVRISLAEMGFQDVTLHGPYDVAEYQFTLPEGWQVEDETFVRTGLNFIFNTAEGEANLPDAYGNVLVFLDGQRLSNKTIQESPLINDQYRAYIPLDLINESEKRTHTLTIALDTSSACVIPHNSRLDILANSTLLVFTYDEQPVQVDLARYPQPFDTPRFNTLTNGRRVTYEFLSGQTSFVLPEAPTIEELQGAMAVATRLGNLGVDVLSMTDQDMLNRIAAGKVPTGNFVVVGTPDRNKVIAQLNQWEVLPTSFKERILSLNSEGPTTVASNEEASYKITVTNPTQTTYESVLLATTLPLEVNVQGCNPNCTEKDNEISWFIPDINPGEQLTFAYTVKTSEVLDDSETLVQTSMVLNDQSEPLGLHSQVTLVNSEQAIDDGTTQLPTNSVERYFLAEKGWGAKTTDGIIQGLVAPWNNQQAILVITGLTNEGVSKAGQAMATTNHLPGLLGGTALIDQIQPTSTLDDQRPVDVSATLAELGYNAQTLDGAFDSTSYQVNVPAGWRLGEGSSLDLKFNHSQLLDYDSSSLRVLFNNQPLAEMVLSEETALNGEVEVEIPVSQAKNGQHNILTVQARLAALERCAPSDNNWLTLKEQTTLDLHYREQNNVPPNFRFFPQPFSQQADIATVLFVLPPEPSQTEWQQALALVSAIGKESSGTMFNPKLHFGDDIDETTLNSHHLVLIGRPTRNPLLGQLNDILPQPFTPDSDQLEQQVNQVVLRSRPDTNLGVLQITESPYNRDLTILAVTGTTDEGLTQAGDVLVYQRHQLGSGTLAFVDGNQINTFNTENFTNRGLARAIVETLPSDLTEAEISVFNTDITTNNNNPAQFENAPRERPRWLIALVAGASILIIATITLAYWQAQRRNTEV